MAREERVLLAALAGSGLALVALLVTAPPPQQLAATLLLGSWLCITSLSRYVRWLRMRGAAERLPFIPLRFSGPTGVYRLLQRGDGREVEIVAGQEVVAQVKATDLRDEIVLNPEPLQSANLADLGSALGQAIALAAEADEEHATAD